FFTAALVAGMATSSRCSAPSAALGGRRHRQQAAQQSSLEQPVKDGSQQRLAEGADVDQQHEHGEDRKRDRQLTPRLQRLPPEKQPGSLGWVAHLSGIIVRNVTWALDGRWRAWESCCCVRGAIR